MKEFVKDFIAQTTNELADQINEYAKEYGLNILQISFCCEAERFYSSRALVLFSKEKRNEK